MTRAGLIFCGAIVALALLVAEQLPATASHQPRVPYKVALVTCSFRAFEDASVVREWSDTRRAACMGHLGYPWPDPKGGYPD